MSWKYFDENGNLKESVSPLVYTTRAVSASTSLTVGDYYIFLLTTSAAGAFTVTLPTAVGNVGVQYLLLDTQGNAHNKNVTIAVQSGQALDGVTNGTYVINTPREQVGLISDGTAWYTT